MKKLLLLSAILWAICTSLGAQEPPNITVESVLTQFALDGDFENVKKMVAAGVPVDSANDDKTTPLMWSAFNGHTRIVAFLLENGASIDMKDANGRTALLYASSGPFPEIVELLLQKNADIDIQGTAEGFTALMMAAAEGQADVVRVLLAHGASTALTDKDGDTAEKFARDNGHTQVVKLLKSPETSDTQP